MNEEAKAMLARLQKEHDEMKAECLAFQRARGPMSPPWIAPIYHHQLTPEAARRLAANPKMGVRSQDMELVITGYKEVGNGPYVTTADLLKYPYNDLARQINSLKMAIELDENTANSAAAKLEAEEKALEAQGEK